MKNSFLFQLCRVALTLVFLFSFLAVNTNHASATTGYSVYDDTDAGWTYAGAGWTSYGATGPYGGHEHYSNVLNATASYTFTGTGFILLYSSDTNRSNVQVTIDATVLNFTEKQTTHLFEQTYASPILASGTHTVTFKNVGPSGTYMTIDALAVLPVTDDTDAGWTYGGAGWTSYAATGPYGGREHFSNVLNSTASYTFTGTGFILLYSSDTNRSNVQVTIDTTVLNFTEKKTVHLFGQGYVSPILASGTHTVTFKNVGPSGTYMTIDAIAVMGSAALDITPPSAITDLSATTSTATNGAVDLSWTAPGNDGTVGTAKSYQVRYSLTPITIESDWSTATAVSAVSIPDPLVSGTTQTMSINGLTPGATYYFAIRASDAASNQGDLSNSPSAAAYAIAVNFCPTNGGTPISSPFFDNMESGGSDANWTHGVLLGSTNDNWGITSPGLSSSTYALSVPDIATSNDSYAAMSADTALPQGIASYLFFKQQFDLEALYQYGVLKNGYDGGVLEYSTNGGIAWHDAQPLFSAGQDYNTTLFSDSSYANDLGGRPTFSGNSGGTVVSRYNLSSLAGQQVRFRWRLGTDYSSTYATSGWVVDDVGIYGCAPSSITNLAAKTGAAAGGSVDLSWTAPVADSYDVRYSLTPITTESDWSSATPVTTGVPTPAAYGTPESITVSGLTSGTTYYFGIRFLDAASDLSDLSNSPSAVASTTASTSGGSVYDDTDAGWTYAGAGWTSYGATGPYGDHEHYSNVLNATASYTFTGTGFILLYSSDTNRSNVQVTIDATVLNFTEKQTTHLFEQTYASPILASGTHTVTFKNVGPSGTYMTIDALAVLPVTDDTDAGWTYGGAGWTSYAATGPYGGREHFSNVLNSTASYTFTGTGFILLYSSDTNRSNVQVTIDTTVLNFTEKKTVHLFGQGYVSPILASGTHTVTFKNVGPSGTYMTIDAIAVIP